MSIDPPPQPTPSSGLRIDHARNDGLGLAVILDEIDLGPGEVHWELTYVSVVWWPGHESPWDESWIKDSPLALSDDVFRGEAGRIEVINGRFSGHRGVREVVVVEAIDSSFWLVWSDDADILSRVRARFPDASPASLPTPFHPDG